MFRLRLKEHTRASHERLEYHPRMRAYASGSASLTEYRETLDRLHQFWTGVSPEQALLGEPYAGVLEAYRAALGKDVRNLGGSARAAASVGHQDETGFYYLLLGSSHGARYMLKQRAGSGLPCEHLRVLADQAHVLWIPFVEHLEAIAPDREAAVLEAADRMFADLHTCMNR